MVRQKEKVSGSGLSMVHDQKAKRKSSPKLGKKVMKTWVLMAIKMDKTKHDFFVKVDHAFVVHYVLNKNIWILCLQGLSIEQPEKEEQRRLQMGLSEAGRWGLPVGLPHKEAGGSGLAVEQPEEAK